MIKSSFNIANKLKKTISGMCEIKMMVELWSIRREPLNILNRCHDIEIEMSGFKDLKRQNQKNSMQPNHQHFSILVDATIVVVVWEAREFVGRDEFGE
jgi:hypothetical protein